MGKKKRLLHFIFSRALSNTTIQLLSSKRRYFKTRKLSPFFSARCSACAAPRMPVPSGGTSPARGRHGCPPLLRDAAPQAAHPLLVRPPTLSLCTPRATLHTRPGNKGRKIGLFFDV